jgi:drug/metabolite transporter (DMT)-like permease
MPPAPSIRAVAAPDPPERRGAALLAVAATVVMWAGGGIAIKAASTGGIVTAFYRLWLAIPALWLITFAVPARRRRLDRAWLVASLGGGTLFALHQLLYFTSLKRTSVANVAVIGALQPSLVLLVAGPLLGEPASVAALGWSAVAVLGTAMVVLGSAGTPAWSLAGDLLAVLNLFAFTGYFVLSKRVRPTVGPWEYVVGMTTVSGLWMLAVGLATGQAFDAPRGADWHIFAGLALLPGTLGHVLTVWAHAHVQAFVSSMLLLAVPVFATAGAVVFLGEPVTRLQLVGGAVAIAAIAAVVATRPRGEREELAESAAATEAP